MTTTPSKDAATKPYQLLHVTQIEDALLKLQTVRDMTGLSTSSIYRRMAFDFPQPVRLSSRCSRWRAGDVTAWLRKQAAQAKATKGEQ